MKKKTVPDEGGEEVLRGEVLGWGDGKKAGLVK